MTQTSQTGRRTARKPSLAAAAAAATKNILGATTAKPTKTELPRAISELHVSPEDVIPAGTVITREIATMAGLEVDDIEDMIDAGHIEVVEVLAMSATSDEAAGA